MASANGKTLDSGNLKDLCPLMMFQLESDLCSSGNSLDGRGNAQVQMADTKKKPTSVEGIVEEDVRLSVIQLALTKTFLKLDIVFHSFLVWGYGVLFVTLISLCSLVGVSVLPLMGKAFYSKMLTVMVGLAVGSLSGSSVFHLIPQVHK